MAPIAGPKSPFATDEPDSPYDSAAPQRRQRQPAPEDSNTRTPAYDVYDKDKLSAPAAPINRNSGIGALLMNMDDDSDSEDEDEPRPTKPPGIQPSSPSKNAALAAAVAPPVTRQAPPSPRGPAPPQQQQQQQQRLPPPPQQQQRPPPQQQPQPPMQQQRRSPPPMQQLQQGPIAAPRPGYAAPIAALNLARPQPAAQPRIQNPFEPPLASRGSPAPSMQSHSSTPHPLPPPVAPIMPVFIRPSSSPSSPAATAAISFSETATPRPRKVIMRGNSEETLLPSRGEKGDDFWRRFSIVAKEPSRMKESSWLRKTQSGSNSLSRWVWVIAIVLLVIIAGGIGLGIYVSQKSPGHQQPTAIGGSADNLASSAAVSSTASGKAKSTSSILHVSPTNTIARRDDVPVATPIVVRRHVGYDAKRRMEVW